MKNFNLDQIHSLAKGAMARVKSLVTVQAWFLPTPYRLAISVAIKAGRHVACGYGLLRTLREGLA